VADPPIVPRWEWRTFGDSFDTAERFLAALEPEKVEESDEYYVLSANSDASVKLRGGVMDMKQLEQRSDDGLELWRPVLKADFPLSADDVRALFDGLAVASPTLGETEFALPALRDLVVATPELHIVGLHKHRVRHRVDDCMVELTDFRLEPEATRTIAIESPDAALVLATITRLGLEGRRNINVARGLKTLVDFGSVRYAVIDVGTNSVKYHRGVRRPDMTFHTLEDRAEITRLGEGLDGSGRLAAEPVERTVDAIVAMVDDARQAGVDHVFALGTAGLRSAPNRDELIDAVRSRCGVTVEVVSGEEEARLAYLAATATLPVPPGRLAVFDSGGGSTQLTFGRPDRIEEQFSVDVGAVRVAERYGLAGVVSHDELRAALDGVTNDLARLDGREPPDALIGMGGTATTLAAVKHRLRRYDAAVVHGTVLDLAELDRQVEQYRTRDADARRRDIVGLQPARADVILAGACLVRTILTQLGLDAFTVCDRGLRHGVPLDRLTANASGPGAEAPGPS
jgi:exopolyphosphatase/guanosine-5'-triphosphate,3'-diphosphate pyrophosphatase